MNQFNEFWEAWPGPKTHKGFGEYTRKKDRPKCEKKWALEKLDEKADEIIENVRARARYDKGWIKDNGKYLEAPLVYLNNERWRDEWADVRDIARARSSAPMDQLKQDEGPRLSRYAIYANKVLFQLAYKNNARGFRPIGDRLADVLALKTKIVNDAESAFFQGDPISDEDYKDICYSSLTEALDA